MSAARPVVVVIGGAPPKASPMYAPMFTAKGINFGLRTGTGLPAPRPAVAELLLIQTRCLAMTARVGGRLGIVFPPRRWQCRPQERLCETRLHHRPTPGHCRPPQAAGVGSAFFTHPVLVVPEDTQDDCGHGGRGPAFARSQIRNSFQERHLRSLVWIVVSKSGNLRDRRCPPKPSTLVGIIAPPKPGPARIRAGRAVRFPDHSSGHASPG